MFLKKISTLLLVIFLLIPISYSKNVATKNKADLEQEIYFLLKKHIGNMRTEILFIWMLIMMAKMKLLLQSTFTVETVLM